MSPHRRRTIHFTLTCTLAGTAAFLLFLSLPWTTGCDASPAAAQLAGLADGSNLSAAGTSAADSLAKLSLSDVSDSVNELQESDALAVPELPPPPPCVEAIRQLTRRCIEETRTIATVCIDEIAQLFSDGQIEAAHLRAKQCKEEINQHTQTCLQDLHEQCRICLEELLNQDAPPDLVEALLRACRRASQHIFRARRTAVGAVEDAVDRGDAQHCIETIHQIAVRCAEQNGRTADECVARIEELLANGQVDEALAAAQDCLGQIRAQSAECVRAVYEHCHDCLQRLIYNCGTPEFVRRVREACETNIHLILESARQAAGQIHDSLPPPPDTQP